MGVLVPRAMVESLCVCVLSTGGMGSKFRPVVCNSTGVRQLHGQDANIVSGAGAPGWTLELLVIELCGLPSFKLFGIRDGSRVSASGCQAFPLRVDSGIGSVIFRDDVVPRCGKLLSFGSLKAPQTLQSSSSDEKFRQLRSPRRIL